MGSDPKMKPLRVCLQAGEWCFAACWAVLQDQHIKTHPRISDSPCCEENVGMKWFLSWVMCGVHNSVPFSPFKMPTSVFTKSLGATVPPVAVVWLVLKSCQHEPAEGLWFKPNPNVLSTGSTNAGAVLLQHWRVRIQKSLPYHCCCCAHWAVQIKSRMGSPHLAPVALCKGFVVSTCQGI